MVSRPRQYAMDMVADELESRPPGSQGDPGGPQRDGQSGAGAGSALARMQQQELARRAQFPRDPVEAETRDPDRAP